MSAEAAPAVVALNQRYLLDYPHEAARQLETMPPAEAAELLVLPAPHAAARTWQALAPDVALCSECPRAATKPESALVQEFRRPHEIVADPDLCLPAPRLGRLFRHWLSWTR